MEGEDLRFTAGEDTEPDLEADDNNSTSTAPLPQSEPEDLSNKSMKHEDVNLDLMAITTHSEVPVGAPKSTPTLSQMPIANKWTINTSRACPRPSAGWIVQAHYL